jgi:hypothetical protein
MTVGELWIPQLVINCLLLSRWNSTISRHSGPIGSTWDSEVDERDGGNNSDAMDVDEPQKAGRKEDVNEGLREQSASNDNRLGDSQRRRPREGEDDHGQRRSSSRDRQTNGEADDEDDHDFLNSNNDEDYDEDDGGSRLEEDQLIDDDDKGPWNDGMDQFQQDDGGSNEDEELDEQDDELSEGTQKTQKPRDDRFSSPAEPIEAHESADEGSNFSSQLDPVERRNPKTTQSSRNSPEVHNGNVAMEPNDGEDVGEQEQCGPAVSQGTQQDEGNGKGKGKGKGKAHPLLAIWFESLAGNLDAKEVSEDEELDDGELDDDDIDPPTMEFDDEPYNGPEKPGRRSDIANDGIREIRNACVRKSHELGIPILKFLKLMGFIGGDNKRKVSDWNLFQAFTKILGLTNPAFAGTSSFLAIVDVSNGPRCLRAHCEGTLSPFSRGLPWCQQ